MNAQNTTTAVVHPNQGVMPGKGMWAAFGNFFGRFMRPDMPVMARPQSTGAMTVDRAMETFFDNCTAKGLSEHTIRFYRVRLRAFSQYLQEHHDGIPVADVTRYMIRAFLTSERERVSACTAKDSFDTLRAFFNFLVGDEIVSQNPMKSVEKPKVEKRDIQPFALDQVQAMLGACGSESFADCRMRALIYVLFDCGLRASELCDVCLHDIDWKRQTIKVMGKGRRERLVHFGANTRTTLDMYMKMRKEAAQSDALFVTRDGKPMNRFGVYKSVKKCGEKAGVTGVRVSPHTFRHSCGTEFTRNGGDNFSLQKLLGHSDLSTTLIYTNLTRNDVVEKHKRFSPGDTLGK